MAMMTVSRASRCPVGLSPYVCVYQRFVPHSRGWRLALT